MSPTIDHEQESVAANLDSVRRMMAAAARAAGRDLEDVSLIAVSKTQPAAAIEAAIVAGQRHFGENRVQEAAAKWPRLRTERSGLVLHMIGPLQTNKVREAIELFDTIHSLDRPKLAEKLAQEMAAVGRRIPCFVQVNTGREPQKAGVDPREVDAFVGRCRETYGLTIAGLMCVPPLDEDAAIHFAFLRELARRNGVAGLSMGMSGDVESAIAFGATHVRIGTAIFGARPPQTHVGA